MERALVERSGGGRCNDTIMLQFGGARLAGVHGGDGESMGREKVPKAARSTGSSHQQHRVDAAVVLGVVGDCADGGMGVVGGVR